MATIEVDEYTKFTVAFAARVANLSESAIMHHRDPFDRILIAQAQLEGLTLVTRDIHIQKYDVDVLTV